MEKSAGGIGGGSAVSLDDGLNATYLSTQPNATGRIAQTFLDGENIGDTFARGFSVRKFPFIEVTPIPS